MIAQPMRRSPVARSLARAGARFELEAGWEVPASFTDPGEERTLLHGTVGLTDVTSRGKVDLRGAIDDAIEDPGDAFVARLARDWAMLLTEPGGESAALERSERAVGGGAMVTDVTQLFAGFALAGPYVPEVLARLTSWDPATLAPGRATGAPLAGIRAVVVRREGALSVVEAYVGTESARAVWEATADAVARVGGGPVGIDALRVEGWR